MRKIIIGMIMMVSSMTLWAERVSEEDAALVANHFMNGQTASSVHGVRKASPAKRMVRKSVNNAEDNQYYVFENADGEGWIIIAADDVVRPVLAYSKTGHFQTENMPVNARKWMSKYNSFIRRVVSDSLVAGEETKAQWRSLRKSPQVQIVRTEIVSPLVQTQWDQDAPFYNLCPGTGSYKAYTGCVATAMAQVMKYWEWPVKGTGSHSYQPQNPNTGRVSTRYTTQSADFENTTYDWKNMRDKYTTTTILGRVVELKDVTDEEREAVATLMYHCGVATEMMYGGDIDGGSGTYTLNYTDEEDTQCAENALWRHFGYNKSTIKGYMRDGYKAYGRTVYKAWSDSAWVVMLKKELDEHHPIMYSGASDAGGHSFICDGYDNEDYFHFNWGWSGSNDGFYLLSHLTPGSGGAGGGDYDFSEEQDAIIGIVPDRPQGIEQTEIKAEKAAKILRDGQILIIRDGKTYSITGQKIEN